MAVNSVYILPLPTTVTYAAN